MYGGGGAEVSLLKEPGGGGGGFLKEDALEGDLDVGGMARDVRELAVDDEVLALPRLPPPVAPLLDCTNRAGEWRRIKPTDQAMEREQFLQVLTIRLVIAMSSIFCNASGLFASKSEAMSRNDRETSYFPSAKPESLSRTM